jgi:hypothetical protein
MRFIKERRRRCSACEVFSLLQSEEADNAITN